MHTTRRSFLIGTTAALCARPVWAQQPPIDVLRIIVGFPPGGGTDVIARRLGEKLRGTYAANVIVENRSGAGGQLAVQFMKQMPADGSVVLVTPAGILGMYPHVFKRLPYDPFKDLMGLSLATSLEEGFAVGPAVPSSVTGFNEYVKWANDNPRLASYGTPGAGSLPHIVCESINRAVAGNWVHVPYRGTQPAIADMVAGQIPAGAMGMGDFLPHIKAGKLRLLATFGQKRSKFAPSVPTLTELRIAVPPSEEWFGIFLPGGTPTATVMKANAAVRAGLAQPDISEYLEQIGLEVTPSSPEELDSRLRRDSEQWGKMVRAIGYVPE
jgi:tripartite-type tricarboxylate transporter receptor subunit TctC